MKFNEEECALRWSIASHLWDQLKENNCVGTKSILDKKECNKRFDWIMYKRAKEEAKLTCEAPNPAAYTFTSDCTLVFSEVLQQPLETFIEEDVKVTKGLKELSKTSEKLQKVFDESFVIAAIDELKKLVMEPAEKAVTEDQAIAFLAHQILTENDDYKDLIKNKMFYIQLFWHKWETDTFKMIVGGVGFGILMLLVLSSGGKKGPNVNQTVVVKTA